MGQHIRVITNNPLVRDCLPASVPVDYSPVTYEEILIFARDLVYGGHRLCTHPLSGSVKPNETPYKSIALSEAAPGMDQEEAILMSRCLETFRKFPRIERNLTEEMKADFQLIDYTLICGALDVDARAGLSNR